MGPVIVGAETLQEAQSKSTNMADRMRRSRPSRPWGLKWRSSVWFITSTVGIGITTDILVYSMIVPIIPFRLQALGYDRVSSLVGWLLFAYSASIVISTLPIAHLSERFKNRKIPLLGGQIALIASQVMLMLAPTYWLMALARVAQGVSASVIWVVGLALVCDSVPEAIVGKQLGFAMMGLSLGFLIGPPVAGALDARFGYHAPFIFGIIITGIELLCRLLIIEKKEAAMWEDSPTSPVRSDDQEKPYHTSDVEKQDSVVVTNDPVEGIRTIDSAADDSPIQTVHHVPPLQSAQPLSSSEEQQSPSPLPQTSLLGLLWRLLRSSRAMTPVLLALVYGVAITSSEPAIPLYLHTSYNLDVSKVGLIYLAAVVPTFISAPLTGWYSDRGGTIASTLVCLVCSLPFWVLITIKGSLAYFIALFAILNFFVSGLISPVMAELAAVTRSLEGIGYGHMYGGFNVAYGIGSAVGPVVGGQLYDHVSRGWMALMLFNMGMIVAAIIVTVCLFGETPLRVRIVCWVRTWTSRKKHDSNGVEEATVA